MFPSLETHFSRLETSLETKFNDNISTGYGLETWKQAVRKLSLRLRHFFFLPTISLAYNF